MLLFSVLVLQSRYRPCWQRRQNQAGPSEIAFRVRMDDLKPETTYYYEVSPEEAAGVSDPATSPKNHTRPAHRMSGGNWTADI